MANVSGRRRGILRSVMMITLLVASMALFYGVTRRLRAALSPRQAVSGPVWSDTTRRSPYKGGSYLVAFVILSGDCGFCTLPETKRAVGSLRDSLLHAHRAAFADVSVVGIVIDRDLDKGMKYIAELPRGVFDRISLGGVWLNDLVTDVIWRGGFGGPSIPQVVVVARNVDVSAYPGNIGVLPDSLILHLVGRDEVVDWVNGGARLDFRPTPRLK